MAVFPATVFLAAALTAPAGTEPVIDNAEVRAVIVTVPPHQKAPLHEPAMSAATVYLDAGTERLAYGDGRAEDLTFQAGEARWTPTGTQYISENTGGKPFRMVEIALKTQGRPARFGVLDPVKLAPQEYRVVIDNSQVRVLHVRIGARQKVPLHEHGLSRVVVYLTNAHLRITDESGKATEATGTAGDVRWAGTAKHAEENLASSPFEVVVVEVK